MLRPNLTKSKEKLPSFNPFENKNLNQKAINMTRSSSKSSLNLTKESESPQTSKQKNNVSLKNIQPTSIVQKSKEKNSQRQTSVDKDKNKQNLKPSILNIKQSSLGSEVQKGRTVKDIRNNLVRGSRNSNIKVPSHSEYSTDRRKSTLKISQQQRLIEKRQEPNFLKKIESQQIDIKISTPRTRQKKEEQIEEPNSILKYIPPQVLAQYGKVSANDFHFISTIQAHTYFKDVLGLHLVLNALFNVRIIDKVSAQKEQLKLQLVQSITILLYLNKFHLPHLLTLYTVFQDANFVYLVMEPLLISKQDQESLLDQIPYKEKMNQNLVSLRIKELATTMNQVHKLNVVLRDLKMDFLRVQLGVLKITLVDSAAILRKRKRRQSFLGDVQKIPQELALGKSYSYLYDSWNLGILLYILATGVKPFCGKDAFNQIKQINYLLPINRSKELTELIFRLLIEQSQRLTAAQTLSHPFLELNSQQKTMVVRDVWAFWHYS